MKLLLSLLLTSCASQGPNWYPTDPQARADSACYWHEDDPENNTGHKWTGHVFEDYEADFIAYYVCK